MPSRPQAARLRARGWCLEPTCLPCRSKMALGILSWQHLPFPVKGVRARRGAAVRKKQIGEVAGRAACALALRCVSALCACRCRARHRGCVGDSQISPCEGTSGSPVTVTPQPFTARPLGGLRCGCAPGRGGAMTVPRCRLETGYGGRCRASRSRYSRSHSPRRTYGSATRNFASRVWGVGLARANNIIIAERCPR